MKKLFMFLAVAGFATFGVSCGSDDNSGGNSQEGQKTLTLKADKVEVKVGEQVAFTISVGESAEAGAELYINNKKVANPYTFDQVGEFNVVAKKNGFKDSNVVKIKVAEGEVIPEPVSEVLLLTALPNGGEVEVAQELTFVFTDANGNQVAGVQLLKDGVAVAGDKYVVVADDATKTIKFAGKKGELTSNEVVFTVKERTNFIKVGDNSYDISDAFLVATVGGDGIPVVVNVPAEGDIPEINYVEYSLAVLTEDDVMGVVALNVLLSNQNPAPIYPHNGNGVAYNFSFVLSGENLIARTQPGVNFVESFNWVNPTATELGQVSFHIKTPTFEIKYEGEYDILPIPQEEEEPAPEARRLFGVDKADILKFNKDLSKYLK